MPIYSVGGKVCMFLSNVGADARMSVCAPFQPCGCFIMWWWNGQTKMPLFTRKLPPSIPFFLLFWLCSVSSLIPTMSTSSMALQGKSARSAERLGSNKWSLASVVWISAFWDRVCTLAWLINWTAGWLEAKWWYIFPVQHKESGMRERAGEWEIQHRNHKPAGHPLKYKADGMPYFKQDFAKQGRPFCKSFVYV